MNNRQRKVPDRPALRRSDCDGGVHARKLEEASYISCKKSFAGRVPRTEYSLTSAGRRALERYLNHMEALIKAARGRKDDGTPLWVRLLFGRCTRLR
jgi:DNA-binding PadR family transcriptional regulator